MTDSPPVPRRVQLSRKKGWRMPPNTVKVARPSGWGNTFRVGEHGTREEVVQKYREWVEPHRDVIRAELRGKNLACFCPLDQPCHADVLLELANAD